MASLRVAALRHVCVSIPRRPSSRDSPPGPTLSTDERDVLLLFAWADLRYEEIAVALQIPIGTVRSRLNRAHGRLRELIGRSGQYLGADNLTEALDSDG
jgi:predicted DNA-binding protein (UPF0251 family)